MDKKNYIPNSFQTPNILIDLHLKTLDPFEYTLLSIIIRKTLGWHKEIDAISVNQFHDVAPKLKIRTISDRLANLEKMGLVEIMREMGKPNKYKLSQLFYDKGYAGDAGGGMQEMQTGYAGDAEGGMQEMQTGYAPGAYTKHIIQNLLIKPTFQKGRQPAGGLFEVQLFFIEKGIADPLANAFKFFNHYETNGWVQGRGKPIKDWRAAPWGSWNFPRSNGKLKVVLINEHPGIDEHLIKSIKEFDRESIIRGLLNHKLIITESNTIEYHFYQETEEKQIPAIIYNGLEVRKAIEKNFLGPS